MQTCKLCPNAESFNYGLKGKDADKTKLLIILHREVKRGELFLEGYWGALQHSATGKIVDKMLKQADLEWKDIYLTNLLKCFIKGRNPRKQEYANCLSILEKQIEEFSPSGIVLFGSQPYKTLFPVQAKKTNLTRRTRRVLRCQKIPCLVSIHPSAIWKLLNHTKQAPHIEKVADFLRKYRR